MALTLTQIHDCCSICVWPSHFLPLLLHLLVPHYPVPPTESRQKKEKFVMTEALLGQRMMSKSLGQNTCNFFSSGEEETDRTAEMWENI